MISAVVWSNYFCVNDEKEFSRFIRKWDLTPTRKEPDKLGFRRVGKDSFGIPRAHVGADGRPLAGDMIRELGLLLAEGQVAIVFENVIAPERAVIRLNAMAIKKGEDPIRLSLNQIYDMAVDKWGVVPTKVDWAI
jgi:hypothetical protein